MILKRYFDHILVYFSLVEEVFHPKYSGMYLFSSDTGIMVGAFDILATDGTLP